MNDKLEKCNCGKIAIWMYAPVYSLDKRIPYFCDDCVPRGCSCNYYFIGEGEIQPSTNEGWKWVKEEVWTYLDEEGREYPCCEFSYEEDGFLKD
jgi:hypothetical protein